MTTLKIERVQIGYDDRRSRRLKPRVYIFVVGENTLEHFCNRWDRPSRLYAEEVMPTVLKRMGLPADTRFVWDQRAGCSCGCSPGFVIQVHDRRQVYVEVRAENKEEATVASDADDGRRASRLKAILRDRTIFPSDG